MLKSLSDTCLEAHAVAIEAILKSYNQIIEALEYLLEDYLQNWDTRRERIREGGHQKRSRKHCK